MVLRYCDIILHGTIVMMVWLGIITDIEEEVTAPTSS